MQYRSIITPTSYIRIKCRNVTVQIPSPWTQKYYFCVPFCPTKENVPLANHRSFASLTRCAEAARFVSSKPVEHGMSIHARDIHARKHEPCTGVTVSEVAVPDVAAPLWAAFVSAATRSLFALDSFAAIRRPASVHWRSKKPRTRRERTSALCLAHVGAHLSSANHTETLRLIERSHFLLGLAKRHAVLQFAELGLGVGFLRFPSSLASTTLLGPVIRNRKCLANLARRWGGETVNMLFDLVSQLLTIRACTIVESS